MKVVIAIDSFKGCLSSLEAGEALRLGLLRADPHAEVRLCPLADGGEGTVEALTAGLGGSFRSPVVTGPLGEPVTARYGILPDGRTAILEMSAAAGLPLVPPDRRDPLYTTTYGVGEMICDAIAQGCRRFVVGIGGSATNDGGVGMLQALGFELLDREGWPIPFGARGLAALKTIRADAALPELKDCVFRVACDVNNPLCGKNGCSAVFGPQKGASPAEIAHTDEWLSAYARLAQELNPAADPDYPGAGAAGGLGFAFLSFLNASLEPGAQIVLGETGLERFIREADVIVTGEGRLDGQTAMGKAPIAVAKLAKKHGKSVLAFAGSVAPDAAVCNAQGIDAFFPILRAPSTLAEAMEPEAAQANLSAAAEQVFRLLCLKQR